MYIHEIKFNYVSGHLAFPIQACTFIVSTYIKSGSCLSVEHLLTKAQNANPSRHDVVMLSTRTL